MPIGSPFTRLCQEAFAKSVRTRADLHIHSTYSDGVFPPDEVIRRAVLAGLRAIALTDHDTLEGFPLAVEAAKQAGGTIEVIPGVEITCTFREREAHLLAYFVDMHHPGLSNALAELRQSRADRFFAMSERLRGLGLSIPPREVEELLVQRRSLGRRHLAELLIKNHHARSMHQAFTQYLCDPELLKLPKRRLPIAEAIALVSDAGGISSWAHPPADATMEDILTLRAFGLGAIECEYPWAKSSRCREMRQLAEDTDLCVTGGSDCHGPEPNRRAIGARTITRVELDRLRR